MKINISDTPAQRAGVYIEQKLSQYSEREILFLVSGGSALQVLEHINTSALSGNITVLTTDERYTTDESGNNCVQLQKTTFYTNAKNQHIHFIDTRVQEEDSHQHFTKRIQKQLAYFVKSHPNAYIIGLFGIGDDGHTAGIFPMAEEAFNELYLTDDLYIANTQGEAPYEKRSTITPAVIEELVDEVILYAVGENKCDNILNYMHNKSFGIHQIPALIAAQHPQSILFTDCKTII